MKLRRHPTLRTVVAPLFAVLMIAALFGCGTQDSASPPAAGTVVSGGGTPPGGGVPPGPTPGDPTVTLADPSPGTITAAAGGSTIRVTVLDDTGAPLAGETVLFSVSPASVASLSPLTSVTDASGQATTTLSGSRAGVASATASFGGVTSAARTVTVLAPNISIATAASQITASVPGVGGTLVTATVTDQGGVGIDGLAVTMQTSLGTLSSVTGTGGGEYQATLTSAQVGTADLSATVLNTTSSTQSVVVVADSLASFVLSPNPSQIVLGGTSTLNVTAQDALGNAVAGVVDFSLVTTPAGIATLSESQVTLADGAATVSLTGTQPGTASVTATLGTSSQTEEVVVVEDLNGVPALVSIAVSPAEITVGDEVSVVTVTITDIFGAPIVDVANNVQLEIISGPSDVLLGGKTIGEVLLLSSSIGVVSAPLQSGTLPGTVKIQARVVRREGPSGTIEPISPPITPAEPAKVLIQSGPPFSLFLGQSTRVINNLDGTYTQTYFANVSDQHGNAVRDGTSVYMGQFINILAAGTGGSVTAGSAAVQSGTPSSILFPATFDGLRRNDAVAILTGVNRGGYLVDTVASTSVDTRSTFSTTDNDIEYVAGNNGGTGGPVLDTGPESFTVSGKAIWTNTYPVVQINEPLVVHAETEGRTVTSAQVFGLGFLEGVQVEVFGPTTAAAGDALDFLVAVRDGGSPRILIGGLGVDVSVDIPAGGVSLGDGDFNGGAGNNGANEIVVFTGRYTSTTGDYGRAAFVWNVPSAAIPGDSFTLTVLASDGNATHRITVE